MAFNYHLYVPTYLSPAQTSLLNYILKCPLDLYSQIPKQHLKLSRSKMELMVFALSATKTMPCTESSVTHMIATPSI